MLIGFFPVSLCIQVVLYHNFAGKTIQNAICVTKIAVSFRQYADYSGRIFAVRGGI
jgi:hypothetical protein